MSSEHDPRVYFAAERTLLAWLRTGLAVMGLGFVVARFGLFLRIVAGEPLSNAWRLESTLIGVSLVLVGSVAIGLATWKHAQFCRTLEAPERPPKFWLGTSVVFAVILSGLGGLLAVYLATKPLSH